MGNIIFEVLGRYFNTLANIGYRKNSDVIRIFLLSYINKLLNNDFRGYITEEYYRKIERTLYCLYGSSCLIPYPDYYSTKNQRIMYNGSVSELNHRVDSVEKAVEDAIKDHEDLNKIKDAIIVVPGENIKEVEDFVL